MTGASLADARLALAQCRALVERLHKMCCEPDRSPRMAAIESALTVIDTDVATGDSGSLARSLERLEEVGAAIGHLQVACCAPARMPLYGEALAQLNTIHLDVTAELGLAH